MNRQITLRTKVLLVLIVLGLLVVTTNFVLTWSAVSLTRTGKHLTSSEENRGAASNDKAHNVEVLGQRDVHGMLPKDDVDGFSTRSIELMEKKLVFAIHQTAQRTTEQRGIVLPLFDKIATLGMSLIMELRSMGVDLPVEVPYCGDLKDMTQRAVMTKEDMGDIRFYDVCAMASRTVGFLDESRKVFCQTVYDCHRSYRGFDIKVLALIFSQFEEVMLLDADTLFFQNPMLLWDTDKYRNTGMLFFHDRTSQPNRFLGRQIKGKNKVRQLHDYVSQFNVSLFAPLANVKRLKAKSKNKTPVKLRNYSPSDFLLTSHSWNYRSGHEMDSSLMLWNKKRQPRATAILASFVAQNDIKRPPSYGDKELFYLAAELAETKFAFSDYGVGGVGWDLRDKGPGKSILCGHAAHYFPVKSANASVLYLNSDAILEYDPKKKPIYYTQARLYEVYPGSFKDRKLRHMCPFDITGLRFTSAQEDHMLLRQSFHEIAKAWFE